jgi:hypothetical protein
MATMTNLKTLVLATALGLGFAGTASAQVFPGVAGTPGRGNSDTMAFQANGAPVSNGYLAEPYQFMRGDVGPYGRGDYVLGDERPLRGSPNSPNVIHW